MARTKAPAADRSKILRTVRVRCPHCERRMWADYENDRNVARLDGILHLRLKIRRCPNSECPRYHVPFRPEAEGRFALPQQEFGLDVIALVGCLRYSEHRSVPEIRRYLNERGVVISERSVTNLLDRYDELLAVTLADGSRLNALLAKQGRIILAIDGMQPDVGHEVLWVLRDCISGEVLLARSLLSSRAEDLAELIAIVRVHAKVPIAGVVSDGQRSIRTAISTALPEVPHQLCQFHYLREAAKPVYEADRHAKKELKKHVRGIRPIERSVEDRTDLESEVTLGYCSAVRSAITDDGRVPLDAPGLKLRKRLKAVSESLGRVDKKRGFRNRCSD